MRKNALIIFYRNPELGKVKTRLAAKTGDEKALAIYLHLASHTREITEILTLDKVVFYSDYIDTEDGWSNSGYHKQLQQGADLGARMFNAFRWAFGSGYSSACIIGTDCLELTSEKILRAFEALEVYDVVVGPAKDGGCYLLGLNKLHEPLFVNKEWGSYTVFSDTLEDLENLKLEYKLLPILTDIDELSDLPKKFKL